MAKVADLKVVSWANQSHFDVEGLTVSGDHVRIPASSIYPSAWPLTTWDLTGSQFVAELVSPPNVSNGSTNANMGVYSDALNYDAYFGWEDNQLRAAFQGPAGGWNYEGYIPYIAADHKYLRIRETSGTLYFEAGPAPDSFPTIVHSVATPWSMTAIRPYLGAGNWASATNPGFATWGAVNPPPLPPGPVTSLKLADGSWQTVTWARIP